MFASSEICRANCYFTGNHSELLTLVQGPLWGVNSYLEGLSVWPGGCWQSTRCHCYLQRVLVVNSCSFNWGDVLSVWMIISLTYPQKKEITELNSPFYSSFSFTPLLFSQDFRTTCAPLSMINENRQWPELGCLENSTQCDSEMFWPQRGTQIVLQESVKSLGNQE